MKPTQAAEMVAWGVTRQRGVVMRGGKDIFGHTYPLWVQHAIASHITDAPSSAYITRCQMNHLFPAAGRGSRKCKTQYASRMQLLYHLPQTNTDPFLRTCLTHTRPCCVVCLQRGDATVDVDFTADYLSCRGVAVTTDAESLAHLVAVDNKHPYYAPFWLSEADFVFVSTQLLAPYMESLQFCRLAQVSRLFRATDISVPVLDDRLRRTRVVNISHLIRSALTRTQTRFLFSAFRRYVPRNVYTGERFDFAIEDALRLESRESRCWCTVWGSFDDFSRAGVPALQGALHVRVLDSVGNPLSLVNALCTGNPVAAYGRVYSKKCIWLRR